MSKQLAKILSFCALAVLLPFIIVGSALTFTQAVGVSLTIAQAGINSTLGLDAPAISMVVDGKVQTSNTIEIRKNSVVDLSFDGEGYHFYGWFEGREAEIDLVTDKPVALDANKNPEDDIKNYVVRGNTVLTAMRDVQKYNITFAGTNADQTTPVSLAAMNEVEYGTRLPRLASTIDNFFLGWQETSTAPATLDAKFEKAATPVAVQDVQLTAVWSSEVQYKVYNSIENRTDFVVMNYGQNGAEKYTATRDGYVFAGLTILEDNAGTLVESDKLYVYDETAKEYICNGETLTSVVVANPDTIICASWVAQYPQVIYFGHTAQAYYTDGEGLAGYWTLVDENGNDINNTIHDAYVIRDSLSTSDAYVEYTDNFMSKFMAQYSGIKTYEGDAVEYSGNAKFVVEGSGQSYQVGIEADDTFGEVYEKLYQEYGASLNEMSFQVVFYYNVVNAA